MERSFDGVRSWAHYQGPVQQAIQKLKYQKDIGLAENLSSKLVTLYRELDWKIDFITAVPMDQNKLTRRGYNQAELLATHLAWQSGLPFISNALIKRFPNRPQVGLSESERLANVLDVFFSESEYVGGRTVLVVDDVVTTGATLNACSSALKTSGALAVYGISLARSLRL
jgi:ComF family protein